MRPQPIDTEGPSAQARGAEDEGRVPGAVAERLVGRQQPPGHGQQQHQGVVGHFLGAVVGHVADDDAARAGRVDVHVVVADAAADDAPAARQPAMVRLADA